MALEEQRAILDQLLGSDRDLVETESSRRVRWDSDSVCKLFVCGFCPHDLFTHTRSHLGQCAYSASHLEKYQDEFKEEPLSTQMRYKRSFLSELERLVHDLDLRIQRSQRSLQETESKDLTVQLSDERRRKIDEVQQRILKLIEESESLGDEGKVDEAEAMFNLVPALQEEKARLERPSAIEGFMHKADKRHSLCETCGCKLEENSNESVRADHEVGKQHRGYQLIRETATAMKEELDQWNREHPDQTSSSLTPSSFHHQRAGRRPVSPPTRQRHRSSRSRSRSRETSQRRRRRSPPARRRDRDRSRSPRSPLALESSRRSSSHRHHHHYEERSSRRSEYSRRDGGNGGGSRRRHYDQRSNRDTTGSQDRSRSRSPRSRHRRRRSRSRSAS